MNKRKFVCLSCKDYDGTVFQTQVLDWLHLYQKQGIDFDLYQAFHIKEIGKRQYIADQLSKIKNSTSLYKGFLFFFPSKGLFIYLNVVFFYLKLFKYFFKYQEILIFSRGLFGKEIGILKKIVPVKLIFYFDARAASAEENKYSAIKQGDFSSKKYHTIAHIYYTEYKTLIAADKIFAVSNILTTYFVNNFKINRDKCVLYPCLSDTSKFFYDEDIRKSVREELKFEEHTKVFLYAGGISAQWHISASLFQFFDQISKADKDVSFLFLTKDHLAIQKMVEIYPGLSDKLIYKSVENDQMVKYLNAADYGILFRENTIMNNVASPTKFAEYILCGLPTIISEGVGDYTDFCKINKVGTVIEETVLNNLNQFDAQQLLKLHFDRKNIAMIGKKELSKESIIKNLIIQFNS